MIRTYNGKRYDMSRLSNGWCDVSTALFPAIAKTSTVFIVSVTQSGFSYSGTGDPELGLELIREGLNMLKSLEVTNG